MLILISGSCYLVAGSAFCRADGAPLSGARTQRAERDKIVNV